MRNPFKRKYRKLRNDYIELDYRIRRLEAAIGKKHVEKFLFAQGMAFYEVFPFSTPNITTCIDKLRYDSLALQDFLKVNIERVPSKPETYKAVKREK